MPLTITIVETPDRHFHVYCGRLTSQDMTWDEMLGEIARLTFGNEPKDGRYMQTPEQMAAREQRRLARAAQEGEQLQRAIDQRRGDR